MKKRKIAIITATRAEYGLLKPLIQKVEDDSSLELQLIVTGMHLSPEFGLTYKEIEQEFQIDKKIEILLSSDTPVGLAKSMGLAQIGFADALDELRPDIVVILGDRYEIFAAAAAAMTARIPLAHIHGGEATEGLIDEAIRHSLTKMSHLHFCAAEPYRKRIIQLGEDPSRVFTVGGLGIESIKNLQLLSREEFESAVEFKLAKKNLLVTYHPVTLEKESAKKSFAALLAALEQLEDTHIIFTKANSDTEGRVINQMIDTFVAKYPKSSKAFTSLGQLRYLSALQYVDGVVGNSSSGLLEAPSFHIGTVNIGERQKGRIKAKSVIDAKEQTKSILKALQKLYSEDFQKMLPQVENPYGNGNASKQIVDILKTSNLDTIVKKSFYDIEVPL